MTERKNTKALIGIALSITVGASTVWSGSDGGDKINAVPVLALCGFLAFAINWFAYIPSAIAQTEH